MAQSAGTVTHNQNGQQFEMSVSSGRAVLRYKRGETQIDLLHTIVPAEDEGSGHGTALVQAAFDYAREANLKIVPTCPFVKAYVDRHPEQRDIVAYP